MFILFIFDLGSSDFYYFLKQKRYLDVKKGKSNLIFGVAKECQSRKISNIFRKLKRRGVLFLTLSIYFESIKYTQSQ